MAGRLHGLELVEIYDGDLASMASVTITEDAIVSATCEEDGDMIVKMYNDSDGSWWGTQSDLPIFICQANKALILNNDAADARLIVINGVIL